MYLSAANVVFFLIPWGYLAAECFSDNAHVQLFVFVCVKSSTQHLEYLNPGGSV